MFGISFSEMVLLAVIALVVIGPKQLPEVARNLGRFLNDLKRSTSSLAEDLKRSAQQEHVTKAEEASVSQAHPEPHAELSGDQQKATEVTEKKEDPNNVG